MARRAVGTVASATSGNISPGIPAGTAANDILLCVVLNGANDVLTFSGAWAKKVEVNNGTAHRMTLAWLRAAGGDAAPTISGATQDIIARIVGYSGRVTSGDPFDGTPTTHVDTSATATITGDAITTTLGSDDIFFCGGQSTTGAEQPTFSGYSGSNPSFAEAIDNVFAGGVVNPAIFAADGIKTDASTTGNRTATSTESLVATGILAALKPATAALTGTATGGVDESDIVPSDKTVIATLTGDTFVPASAISDISFIANALGGTTTTTSFSTTLPATQAGDIIILEFSHRGTGDGTIGGTYSGPAFTLKHSQLFATSAFSGKTYYSRATGNHSGQTVTGSGLTDSCAAIVTIYRGALASGDPLADATIVGEQNASGNETQAEITTATDKAVVVLVVVNSPDLAVATQACTSPGALTERAERLSTGGTDSSIAHASAVKDTAGATGALTWTQTNAASGSWAYAIKPNTTTPFADARQEAIDGLESAQSETHGFNAERANIAVTSMVRTSDNVATLTLTGMGAYDITAQETLGWTLPGSILTGGSPIVATPTFTVDPAGGASDADFDAAGDATATFSGESSAGAALSAPGEAAASFASEALFDGVLSGAAEADAGFVGEAAAQDTGALSGIGEAEASFTGSSTADAVLSALGEADATFDGSSLAGAVLTAQGETDVVLVGEAQADGVLAGAAQADASFVGEGISEGSTLSAPGEATAAFAGSSLAAAVLQALGESSASLVGRADASAVWAAAADSTGSFVGQVIAQAAFSAAGESSGILVGEALAASVLVAMAEATFEMGSAGGVFYVAGPENTRLGEARVREIIGEKRRALFGPTRTRSR